MTPKKTEATPRPTPVVLGLLWCVALSSAQGATKSNVFNAHRPASHSDFVSDYIAFYNIRVVTFLTTDEADRNLNSWSKQLVSRIHRQQVYFSVVNMSKTRNGTQELRLGDSGLVVARLETRTDLNAFVKMFTASSIYLDWLLLSEKSVSEMLADVYLPINSKVVFASFTKELVLLWESYQIDEEFPQKTYRVGDWTPRGQSPTSHVIEGETEKEGHRSWTKRREMSLKGLKFGIMRAPTDDPILHRDDLTGLHLRCATIQYSPLTTLTHRNDGTVTVSGVLGSVFEEMARRANFTYTCRRSRDGQWGAVVDGEWTGIVRDILDDMADIGVAALDITQTRSVAVSYLHSILSGEIFMKKPTNDDHMWTVYTKQFSVPVWLSLGALSLLLSLMMFLTTQRSPGQDPVSLFDSGFMIFGFISGKDTCLPLLSTSTRIVAMMCLMLQVLLMAYYTSDLVSSLAAGPPPPSLSTLHDVHNSPRYQFGFTKGIALQLYFTDTTDVLLKEMWKSIEDANYKTLTSSLEEGMERVLQKPFIYMDSGIPLRYTYGHDCRLYMLPTSYFPVKISFTLKKKSPLVPVFNKMVLDLLSSGLVQRWWKDFTTQTTGCGPLQNAAVGLKAVFGPFFMLAMGLLTSVFILVLETFKKRKTEKSHSN